MPSLLVLAQLKALAHEIRYDLVRLLAQGERCVCDRERLLVPPQSNVSYHLPVLRDAGAGLVHAGQRSRNMYDTLCQERLFRLGGAQLTDVLISPAAVTHQIHILSPRPAS